jgi:Mrp family chromosome partitioning ATPase
LEVEHFLWPDLIADLEKRVAGPLRELAAEFSAASAGGCRVLLFVGEHPGCGVTSLVLAAARQLAQHGLGVAVADANFARPDLAAYLGIAAQVGWEDVMTRQSGLADALVESTADRLTLLPLKGPVSPQETPLDFSLAAETLRQLRRGFDLVLVDGGSLDDPAAKLLLARLGNGTLEGIVNIQDARNAREGLRRADPAAMHLVDRLQIGTIENFAA